LGYREVSRTSAACSKKAGSSETSPSASVPNTTTIFIPAAYQTAASLPTASLPNATAAASLPNATAAASLPNAAAAASLPNASLPSTASASIPTTASTSVTTTTLVESSEFALDPIKAKEFHDAADDKSIPLADFLRKLQLTENIYGDDTDMINSLTSNTSKHEKEKLKVCSNYSVKSCCLSFYL
jgi:hypothetical protein